MNISSDNITELQANEIFVFGSNEGGRHGKGAAKTAFKWGAVYGRASGLQGQTYAIPTMNANITRKLSIREVNQYVERFYEFAKKHPELKFLVTEIGCGLAGFTPSEIAPLFENCSGLENVYLPRSFWNIIMPLPNQKEETKG
ncbi:MAG TPA: hypothetical protein VLX91_05685 [Candidatus Acidoferrales bacterium]|nr:hypothetical protein [Candidatus Acidoferrales bacterium]